MVVVSMSKQEFSRLEVLLRVQSGRLHVSDACVLIGLQRRQVFRLLRGLKQDGATSLLSKRRGRRLIAAAASVVFRYPQQLAAISPPALVDVVLDQGGVLCRFSPSSEAAR